LPTHIAHIAHIAKAPQTIAATKALSKSAILPTLKNANYSMLYILHTINSFAH